MVAKYNGKQKRVVHGSSRQQRKRKEKKSFILYFVGNIFIHLSTLNGGFKQVANVKWRKWFVLKIILMVPGGRIHGGLSAPFFVKKNTW